MPKSLWIGARTVTPPAVPVSSTAYLNFGGNLFQTGTELNAEMPVREAGVFSKLYIRISANANTGTSVFTVRKSAADTSITVSVTTGATGVFEDITNSATYAATDEIALKCVSGVTGTSITISEIKIEFDPTSLTQCIGLAAAVLTTNLTTASANRFHIPSGVLGADATESNQNWRVPVSLTSSDFYTNVLSNARTTTTTVGTRKNSAAGGQSVSVGSGATGIFEDASGSDTLVAGDDYCYYSTTGTGTGTLALFNINTTLISSDGKFPLIAGNSAGISVSFNVTTYNAVAGRLEPATTIGNSLLYPRFSFLAQNLTAKVTANTIATTATTVTIMDDSVAGVGAISIAAGGTGVFTDASGVDLITATTDDINYRIATPNTSGALTFRFISITGDYTRAINFDATTNSGYNTADANYSWSHTCSGVNRYLLVSISMLSVGGSSVSSIDYNGDALTLIRARASAAGAIRVELWGLVNPDVGSNTITVTLSAALDSVGGAVSLSGVHQTTPTEGDADASATNIGAADATVNVTTVADNDWVIDGVATDDTAITVGAGQTQAWNVTGTLGSGAGSYEPKGTPGAVTMSWTNVGALATWTIVAVAIRPAYASVSITLNADVGSFALSGQSADLLKGYSLSSEVGSFLLNGQSAGLFKDYVLGSDFGSFLLNGQDAGLLRGLVIGADMGSYSLSGQDAGLLRGYVVGADFGSFALSGQDAGLLVSYSLPGEVGSFALNGQDAGLLYARILEGGVGLYSLSGQDAGLFKGLVLQADNGSFSLDGQVAGLIKGAGMIALVGTFNINGQDVVFVVTEGFVPRINFF